MKIQNATDFWTQILPDFGFQTDEDGKILYWHRDKKGVKYIPLVASGTTRNIVIPTSKTLRDEEGKDIIFHPLTENALKGTSYNFRLFSKQGSRIIDTRLRLLLLGLGKIIIDHKSKVAKGGKKQRIINLNPDWNEKAQAKLVRLLNSTTRSDPKKHLIGIYTHAENAKLDGKDVTRISNVSSALLDQLTLDGKEVLGIPVSKAEKKALIQLINTVLPGVNEKEYDAGSNSKVAPYFEAYVKAWLNVSEKLDETVKIFGAKNFYDEFIPLPTYEWVNDFLTNLPKLSRVIQPQLGNIGDDIIGKITHNIEAAAPNANSTINESKPNTNTNTNTKPNQQNQNKSTSGTDMFGLNNTAPVNQQGSTDMFGLGNNFAPTNSINMNNGGFGGMGMGNNNGMGMGMGMGNTGMGGSYGFGSSNQTSVSNPFGL